jgi:hypothetical protein
MITSSDIKKIFKNRIPTGKRILVWDILAIVEDNFALNEQDWTPHPSELRRGSTYPSWKRKVQAVLHSMKLKGLVKHFEESNEYIF